MLKTEDIPEIISFIREQILALNKQNNIKLELQDWELDDGDLFVYIGLSYGTDVLEYSESLAEIEKELREHEINDTFLLPTTAKVSI